MSFTSSSGIASALNDFFANIGTKLSNKFSPFTYDFTQYLQRPSSSFNVIEISQEFVRGRELGRLKLNKATGLDKVSVRLLKDSMDIITPSLTYLLNMSIESSVFQCTWKNAKLCALFKSGNRSDPSCYRPISILPTISKIHERAIHHQFFKYIKDNNLLSDKNVGFKPLLLANSLIPFLRIWMMVN